MGRKAGNQPPQRQLESERARVQRNCFAIVPGSTRPIITTPGGVRNQTPARQISFTRLSNFICQLMKRNSCATFLMSLLNLWLLLRLSSAPKNLGLILLSTSFARTQRVRLMGAFLHIFCKYFRLSFMFQYIERASKMKTPLRIALVNIDQTVLEGKSEVG